MKEFFFLKKNLIKGVPEIKTITSITPKVNQKQIKDPSLIFAISKAQQINKPRKEVTNNLFKFEII